MKSIKLDFVRSGNEKASLQKGQRYHVVIESSRHRQFDMPLNQADFLDKLTELRYHKETSDQQREAALRELSQAVTEILMQEVILKHEMTQLDLVTSARELWALPLEAALGPDGKPLFVQRKPVVVLTRRYPKELAERPPNWPARPRILFAYATPDWAGGPKVPAQDHKKALLEALQPWVESLPGLDMVIGNELSVLTTLKEASLLDIENACRAAESEKKPFTHIHLLAHGLELEDSKYKHRTRFGLALHSEDKKAVSPEALVQAIRPPVSDKEQGQQLPVVVTLAICDGGNAANSIIEAGSVAQELHRADVPIVVASQLPLTFPGSVILVGEFYKGWMAGKDVREVLHDVRVALYEAEGVGHDWVSLVNYVRLPEGYNDYLCNVRLQSQFAALETASNYANNMLENHITDSSQYDQVVDRMQQRIQLLENLLNQYEATGEKPKQEVIQENAGLLGSAYKRLAELYYRRAAIDKENESNWRTQSISALEKARDGYRSGFLRNPSHHWSGVQFLALDAVLTGKIARVMDWYACYVAATAQCNLVGGDERGKTWAYGSIAELILLAPLGETISYSPEEGVKALTTLRDRVKEKPEMYPDPSPIQVTRRQLMRYVDWWTKSNDYFLVRASDLANESKNLVQLLDF